MTGAKSGFLYARSKNTLKGWLRNGRVLIGYKCDSGFYVRANDVGFATDRVSCSEYGCKNVQFARVRFDNGSTKEVNFDVWDDNNDGMSLFQQTYDMETYMINSMKAGTTMYLELEMSNTDGAQQIAEFSLIGFTKAFNQCP